MRIAIIFLTSTILTTKYEDIYFSSRSCIRCLFCLVQDSSIITFSYMLTWNLVNNLNIVINLSRKFLFSSGSYCCVVSRISVDPLVIKVLGVE
jgi:hypothetical protein